MKSKVVSVAPNSDFSIYNLPFGIFSTANLSPRAGVAIGDKIIDLSVLARQSTLDINPEVLDRSNLNDFIALGKPKTSAVRSLLQEWLQDQDSPLAQIDDVLVPMREAHMHLPVRVGNYTDFYSSRHHAENVGRKFRDPAQALLPNWLHLPVAYHGRASSIVVSGTDVRRPNGQVPDPGGTRPKFRPTEELDFELEIAMIIGKSSPLGQPVPIEQAYDHIFGLTLFNDWSARDIQRWEYRPLGPFLGKSFASTMSPWVVTMEALAHFRTEAPEVELDFLPYLREEYRSTFDIELSVSVLRDQQTDFVSRSNFKHVYWTLAQQLAHHTSNGCNLQIGDVLASGTISGPTQESVGSLLEKQNAEYLHDGDVVTLRGFARDDDIRVGFGKAEARILPAGKTDKM